MRTKTIKKLIVSAILALIMSFSLFAKTSTFYVVFLYFYGREPVVYRNCTDISYQPSLITFTYNNGAYSTKITASCQFEVREQSY